MSKGHEFVISILHPDGNKTNMVAGFNLKNSRGWYEVETVPRIFAIDSEYKDETLFFSIIYDYHQTKPGTYTISLKVKDYLPPCESINITIKGLFLASIW